MIPVTEYSGRPVGVFGLGRAGEATVQALLAGGAEVYAWDDKLVDSPESSVVSVDDYRLKTIDFTQWPWEKLAALVPSPGVPLTHPRPHAVVEQARKHGCAILGDIELLMRACPKGRYVGITGTNGKSTTTTLIGHILKSAGVKTEIGGNLGTPALALEPPAEGGTYVLEASSYQLDLLEKARFHVAVLLNITPDHLDRHGSMEGYIAAKKHIFDRQREGDVAVIAVDDEHTRGIWNLESGTWKSRVIPVSSRKELEDGVYVKDGFLHDTSIPDSRFQIPDSTLTGRHNWQNAAAAWAAARACGIAPATILEAMKSFPGLRHRMQQVAVLHGVRFINDSKATNAEATAHALEAYDNIYWIAGGKPKEGGIAALEKYSPKIAHAFLIGEAQEDFARTLEGKAAFTLCGTLKVAVEKAAAAAFAGRKQDAVVLLSPACASFDQWKNFEERGDAFCEMVGELIPLPHRGRDRVGAGVGNENHNTNQECPPPSLPPTGGGV